MEVAEVAGVSRSQARAALDIVDGNRDDAVFVLEGLPPSSPSSSSSSSSLSSSSSSSSSFSPASSSCSLLAAVPTTTIEETNTADVPLHMTMLPSMTKDGDCSGGNADSASSSCTSSAVAAAVFSTRIPVIGDCNLLRICAGVHSQDAAPLVAAVPVMQVEYNASASASASANQSQNSLLTRRDFVDTLR
jgi:hypothetical protein